MFNKRCDLSQEKIKIKPMNLEELSLAIDRLTRFKFPEIKYNRVFREMIAKHLIIPKISFKEYENLPLGYVCELIEKIFNESLSVLIKDNKQYPCELYKKVVEFESQVFFINEQTSELLRTKVPYEAVLSLCDEKNLSPNLKFWRVFMNSTLEVKEIRKKYNTKFPIEKLVLAEGITEEILLPKFAKILGHDFDKNGILVIPAGGKNQVAKDYLKFSPKLKIPIVVLLDADAKPIAETILAKLRNIDQLILIEKGEFEDILPLELVEKAINYKFLNLFKVSQADFSSELTRVKNLEEIYRINALGEFKKAEFAHNVEAVIASKSDTLISQDIKNIVAKIISA